MSLSIAAYKVACGVLPPGLVKYFFAAICSIICLAVSGSLDSLRTLAAALIALSFRSVATTADFSEAGFLTVVFFVATDFRVADFLVATFFVDCLVAIVSSPLCIEFCIRPAIDVTAGNRTVSYRVWRGTSSDV